MNDLRIFQVGRGGHGDTCTPALCGCGLGYKDGTPVLEDYEKAGQPRPGMGQPIDNSAVQEEVRKRMALIQPPSASQMTFKLE
jgi:hypothetical protein